MTMDPPAGYIVLTGTQVTTTCDEGYSVGSQGSVVDTCGAEKFCSRKCPEKQIVQTRLRKFLCDCDVYDQCKKRFIEG